MSNNKLSEEQEILNREMESAFQQARKRKRSYKEEAKRELQEISRNSNLAFHP